MAADGVKIHEQLHQKGLCVAAIGGTQRSEERGSEPQLNACVPGSVMLVSDWIRLH